MFEINRIYKAIEDYSKSLPFNELKFTIVLQKEESSLFEYSRGDFSNDTAFPLASLSKQFIAFSIFDKAKKEIGTIPLSDFFSDKKVDNLYLSDLLAHTSGIPEYIYLPSDKEILNWSLEKTCNYILSLDFNKKGIFLYSNSNYVLLSKILELIEGRDYSKIVSESIFEKLNMQNSFSFDYNYRFNEDLYVFTKENIYKSKVTRANMGFGDSGFFSSINDLLVWSNSSLFRDYLSIKNSNSTYYEKGFFRFKDIYYHSGSTLGAESFFCYDQRSNTKLVYGSNHSSNDQSSFIKSLEECLFI